LLLFTTLSARVVFSYSSLSLFAAPFILPVMLIAPRLRQTNALALHLLQVTVITPMMSFAPGMILIPLIAGWSGVLLLRPNSNAISLLATALFSTGLAGASMLGLEFFVAAGFDFSLRVQGDLVGLAVGCGTAGLASILLRYPVTLMYGAIPASKLIALRDLEHPVLSDLAEKAPGTFQHTLSAANMAEKVAHDIGADDKLIRVGAYYHDIGKMRQPEYFVENQKGKNPHDQLHPLDSVAKIRSHVTDGVTIAHGANLPERLIDFIVEHHGCSTMDYFLVKAGQQMEKGLDPAHFSYQGRNPTSRESALLMIVDAVEAASRTLKDPDQKEVENLIRQIVFSKLQRSYLNESKLDAKDLQQICSSLIGYLSAQFHVRIKYPWQQAKT
jgi:putative nucleotidyltransferase with HDIG domain